MKQYSHLKESHLTLHFPAAAVHSPENKEGIVSYSRLSSCSTGILGLLVASFWGEFQNFNTRNDIKPPIAVDKKYIQIFWDTHIFSPSSTGVYAKEPNIASLFSANVILHLTTATPLWLADSNLIGVCDSSRQWRTPHLFPPRDCNQPLTSGFERAISCCLLMISNLMIIKKKLAFHSHISPFD